MSYINFNVSTIRIWFISDTHGRHAHLRVPDDIDIVIHGGDISIYRDTARNYHEANAFFDWYRELKIPYKLYIPGNHDTSIEAGLVIVPDNVIMLINQSVEIEGLHIYGSPYTPAFGYGWAYNIPRRSDQMKYCWEMIPENVDLLITHTPPKNILDLVDGEHVGCEVLAARLDKIKPRIHMFGHIHEQGGESYNGRYDRTVYLNASTVGYTDDRRDYKIIHNGFVVNYEKLSERET